MYTLFFPCCNLVELVSSPHIGQALYPFTVQPHRFSYAGKSLIVHSKTAHKVKDSSMYASKHSTPTSYKSFKSSINRARYILSYPSCFGPDININNIKNFLHIHNHGEKLYTVIMTSQQLYLVLRSSYGFTLLVDKPKRRCLGSEPKAGHK